VQQSGCGDFGTEGIKNMKIAKAIAILLIGPIVGIFVAFLVFALTLPPDPNFVANGSHASPGDGFLFMGCIVASLVISSKKSPLHCDEYSRRFRAQVRARA
jgi:hypothetical protein